MKQPDMLIGQALVQAPNVIGVLSLVLSHWSLVSYQFSVFSFQ
jgi:hypothetical protein